MRANGVTRGFRVAVVLGSAALVATSCAGSTGRESIRVAAPAGTTSPCALNAPTEAITGAYGSASAIGWAGNYQGVVTCLGGSFYVQDGIEKRFGFGIYAGGPTKWVDAEGYLPAQVTTFRSCGRERRDHRIRRRGGARWQSLRRGVQPRRGRQSDRHDRSGRSAAHPRADPAHLGTRHARSAPLGGSRLCRRGRPVRQSLRLAVDAGVGRRRRLRPALRAHALLLDRSVAADRAGARARRSTERRVPQWVHLHADRAQWQRPRHRREQLRDGVQPRRHRHPGQSLHAGRLRRRARAAARSPVGRGLGARVRRRGVDVRVAMGDLPAEDRGPRRS